MVLKIPLIKGKSLGFERDMVTFSLKWGALPRVIASGIVDTGYPYVILSENVFKRSRIPYNSLPVEPSPVNIGGITLELKNLGECHLFFRNEEGNLVELIKQRVFVGVPIGFKNNQMLIKEIPSFIGNEFLDSHDLSIMNDKGGKKFITDFKL